MPRGARKDTAVTTLLYANLIFLDKRSFVSLDANQPHLYLKGADIVIQRHRVWDKQGHYCAMCKTDLMFSEGEMDHKQGGNVGRCDCRHNLQILCRDCHQKKTRHSEHH